MRPSLKFVIYFIIIASEIDYLWSRPVDVKAGRKRRQVVQPKWLSRKDKPTVDPNVRVTEQNLKEAAAIRAAIEKSIKSGTFAVEVDQPNAPIPTAERSKPVDPKKPAFPKFSMPEFEMPQFDFPQFNITDFGLPELDFSEINPVEFFEEHQRKNFLQQVNRLWQQFWDNSKKFLSSFH